MNKGSIIWNIVSWLFGIFVFAQGIVNMVWGNDFGFGAFLLLLSLIYFPPVNKMLKQRVGFSIHYGVKLALGAFIIWATMAVGAIAEGYVF